MNNIQPIWHTFGHKIHGTTEANQAIAQSGLNWKVEKRPVYTEFHDHTIKAGRYSAIVRTDNSSILGIVGNRYQPLQNTEAFDFVDGLAKDGSIKYEVAGSVDGGKKTWMLAKVDSYEVLPGDETGEYLLLINAHDGTSQVKVMFTTIRAICYNMITLATTNAIGDIISVRHTSNIIERIQDAKEILGSADNYFTTYRQFVKDITRIQLNSDKLEEFTKAVIPAPKDLEKYARAEKVRQKKRDRIIELFENGIGQDIPGVAGTGWAAYNAVTEYANKHRPVRKKDKADETRFINVAFAQNDMVRNAVKFLVKAA